MANDLVPSERARLTDLEQIVDRGIQTFYEVGRALLEIRDSRLYRETHKTFNDYCRERFGFSDSRGRQLIAAAKTVTDVTLRGLPAPKTESEARELARQLRAQADELDGGSRVELIANIKRQLEQADEMMHAAIAEANLAIAAADGDQAVLHDAEEIIEHAYAMLNEEAFGQLSGNAD